MPVREAHGQPPDLPNLQRQGSIVWKPVFIVPKACVCGHEAWRPMLDEGAQICPDPWPNLGIITTDPDICIGSASQLEGEQNIHLPYVGGKLHAAPSAPQNSLSLLYPLFYCHLKPLCARIHHVEKAPPPIGMSLKIVAPNSGRCQICILKSWRNQGECQHWATHLSSLEIMAAPGTLTILGLHAWLRMWTLGKSNPCALTCTNKGERCQSQVLQQPWLKEPLASDLLARLRQPVPLGLRRWSPG